MAMSVAVICLQMSQLYDYECRSNMTTDVAPYHYECAAEFPNVQRKFFGCPVFPNIMFLFIISGYPRISQCPFFPNIMFFQISRYPRISQTSRFSLFPLEHYLDVLFCLEFFIYPVFPGCHAFPEKWIFWRWVPSLIWGVFVWGGAISRIWGLCNFSSDFIWILMLPRYDYRWIQDTEWKLVPRVIYESIWFHIVFIGF